MKKNILIIILITLYIFGCEDIPDDVVNQTSPNLQVNQINAPLEFEYDLFDSSYITSVSINSIDELKEIWMDVYTPTEEKMNQEPILLKDDGTTNSGDIRKNDKIYSARIFLGSKSRSGTYKLIFYLSDKNDNQSQIGEHNFKFKGIDIDNPPQIANLEAPDSLRLTSEIQLLTLKVEATDADGLSDIRMVFFNSFLPPDGRPSVNNPIMMFDDASNGDITSGDGIYSVTIQMPPATPKGTYRFEFQAIDRLNVTSNKIIHQVVVY